MMLSNQVTTNSTAADEYEQAYNKANHIYRVVESYAFIPALMVIIPLAVYLIKTNRRKRFEWSILILITLKYLCYALYQVVNPNPLNANGVFFIILRTLRSTIGPISREIYAS